MVLAAIALAVVALSRDARRVAATNDVPTSGVAAEIARGDTLCRAEVRYRPDRPGCVRTWSSAPARDRSRLQGELRIGDTPVRSGVGSRVGPGMLVVPFEEVQRAGAATVCFTNVGRSVAGFGGVARDAAAGSPLEVEAKRVPYDISVDVVLPKESLFAAIDRASHRATIWGPSWAGDWTIYAVLVFALGMLALGTAITLRRRPGRGEVWAIAAIALAGGLGWAAILPPWQAPDEIEHFAYVQYLAETGELPGLPGALDRPTALPLLEGAAVRDGAVLHEFRAPQRAGQAAMGGRGPRSLGCAAEAH